MGMLDDLMKALSTGGAAMPAQTGPAVPTPQGAIPTPQSVPTPQSDIPAPVAQVTNKPEELPPMSSLAAMAAGGGSAVPYKTPDWLTVEPIPEYTGAIYNPNPDAPTAAELAAEKLNKVVTTQPPVKDLLNAAADVNPSAFENIPPEDMDAVGNAGDKAVELLESNEETDPKTVMSMAGKALGSLFEDKAIQQALIYYTGARLMGYSGSGSGMAAGNVLLQGWKDQADKDLLTQTATSKANAKKAENDALDMSKTVSMWDPRAKRQDIGYMSKSGNFQRSSGGEIYNAKARGLQTYDKSNPMHRTDEEIDKSNVANMDKAVKDVLSNVSNNKDIYTDEQRQTAQALFADGADLNAAYAIATRSAREAKADTSSIAYQNAVTGSIRKYMMRTIKNPTDAFSGNNVAAMADAIRSDQLKADLTKEGSMPEFVFGKGTWNADGISEMEEDYQLPYEAAATLNKRVDNINANLRADAVKNNHSTDKIASLITPTKTLQKLAGIFKETVMKDPAALEHWSIRAEEGNTNAMGAWLASGKSTADHKYLGINNPDIAAKFELLVDKQLEKK